MKDISEFEKDYIEALKKVETDLGTTMVKIGASALNAIYTRVTETGKDATGKGFPPYSTEPMLVGCKTFKKRDCNKFFGKQKNKEHRWATLDRTYTIGPKAGKKIRLAYLEGGYRELREMELSQEKGEQVDFFYTGSMWGNISLLSTASDHDNGTVIIGAKLEEEKNKLTYNTERNLRKGGNEILDLSEKEIDDLKEMFLQPILNVFK